MRFKAPRSISKAAQFLVSKFGLASLAFVGSLALVTGGLSQSGGIIGTGAPILMGIVGTLTGTGSLIINGERVRAQPGAMQGVAVGDRLVVIAEVDDQGFVTNDIARIPETVAEVIKTDGKTYLLGSEVVGVLDTEGRYRTERILNQLRHGDWVSVDAAKLPNQRILVGNIKRVPPQTSSRILGTLARSTFGNGYQVAGQAVQLNKNVLPSWPFVPQRIVGRTVLVEGVRDSEGVLQLTSMQLDPVQAKLYRPGGMMVLVEGTYSQFEDHVVFSTDIGTRAFAQTRFPEYAEGEGLVHIMGNLNGIGELEIKAVRPWTRGLSDQPFSTGAGSLDVVLSNLFDSLTQSGQ